MPDVRLNRFISELGLSEEDAVTLTDGKALADYFEKPLSLLNEPKAIANLILTEVLRILNEKSITISEFTISPEQLTELISLKLEDKINSSAMQEIFKEMLESDKRPASIAEEMNLIQVSDTGFIDRISDQMIADNSDDFARYVRRTLRRAG